MPNHHANEASLAAALAAGGLAVACGTAAYCTYLSRRLQRYNQDVSMVVPRYSMHATAGATSCPLGGRWLLGSRCKSSIEGPGMQRLWFINPSAMPHPPLLAPLMHACICKRTHLRALPCRMAPHALR